MKTNRTSAFEYDDITVDEGSRVSSDLAFDPNRMHLYVMTERKVNDDETCSIKIEINFSLLIRLKVAKVRVQDCGVYSKTCGKCLGAKDPYCGWCSKENK